VRGRRRKVLQRRLEAIPIVAIFRIERSHVPSRQRSLRCASLPPGSSPRLSRPYPRSHAGRIGAPHHWRGAPLRRGPSSCCSMNRLGPEGPRSLPPRPHSCCSSLPWLRLASRGCRVRGHCHRRPRQEFTSRLPRRSPECGSTESAAIEPVPLSTAFTLARRKGGFFARFAFRLGPAQ
jgi:hypothetical protein